MYLHGTVIACQSSQDFMCYSPFFGQKKLVPLTAPGAWLVPGVSDYQTVELVWGLHT